MSRVRHASLIALAALAMAETAGIAQTAARHMPPMPKPRPPTRSKDPEIAAWNEAVEAKKAAKKARKGLAP